MDSASEHSSGLLDTVPGFSTCCLHYFNLSFLTCEIELLFEQTGYAAWLYSIFHLDELILILFDGLTSRRIQLTVSILSFVVDLAVILVF